MFRTDGADVLVLVVLLAAVGAAVVVTVLLARRPITSEPKDPSWTVWFALVALVVGVVLTLAGQPAGGLLLLLGAVWGLTGWYRFLRMRRYLEHLRATRSGG